MILLTDKASEAGKHLRLMLSWVAISSFILTYVSMSFVGTPLEGFVGSGVLWGISWALQIWWLVVVAAIIWRTSHYMYSTITVTMLSGEVHHFDCSPKVCRVFKSYIRILKRDENNVVIQELQINEIAIKQIEYLK